MKMLKEFVVIAILFIIMLGVANWALTKQERSECERWSARTDYTVWQDWQRAQCDHYGMPLAKPKGK